MKEILCVVWLLIVAILSIFTILGIFMTLCKPLLFLLSYVIILMILCSITGYCIDVIDNWLDK